MLYLVKTAVQFPDDILIRVITETKDSIFFFFFFLRYSQFQEEYTLDEVLNSRKIFDYLTVLQCW